MALSAFAVNDSKRTITHGLVGTIIPFWVMAQGLAGYLLKWGLKHEAHRRWHRWCRRLHRLSGYAVLLTAWYNCILGLQLLQFPLHWPLAWLGLLVCVFVVLELRLRGALCFHVAVPRATADGPEPAAEPSKSGCWGCPTAAARRPGALPGRLGRVPVFSWAQINARVEGGASWVVLHGLVLDVSSWIKSHPGGQRLLWAAVGTDVTADFTGCQPSAPVLAPAGSARRVRMPRTSQSVTNVPNVAFGIELGPISQAGEASTTPPTASRALAALRSHVASGLMSGAPDRHAHSAVALRKAMQLVVGRVERSGPVSDSTPLPSAVPSPPGLPKWQSLRFIRRSLHGPAHAPKEAESFSRYSLVCRIIDTPLVERAARVIRLTLVPRHARDELSQREVLPGHSYLVQVRAGACCSCRTCWPLTATPAAAASQLRTRQGVLLTRSYTPLTPTLTSRPGSLEFCVKVYPLVRAYVC